MSSEHEELNSIEQSLGSFVPAAPQFDRDRLMFLAGQASGRPGTDAQRWSPPDGARVVESQTIGKLTLPARQSPHWLWPAATATLAATSLGLAIALFTRPAPQTRFIVRDMPISAPAETDPAAVQPQSPQPSRLAVAPVLPSRANGDSYFKTREVALRMGLDALGSPSSGGSGLAPGATYLQLLEGLAGGSTAGPATGSKERLPNM